MFDCGTKTSIINTEWTIAFFFSSPTPTLVLGRSSPSLGALNCTLAGFLRILTEITAWNLRDLG